MLSNETIYSTIRIPVKFIELITSWHLLPWWRVKNHGLGVGFAIESLDERIKNLTTSESQDKLNTKFLDAIKSWKKKNWIPEDVKGIH